MEIRHLKLVKTVAEKGTLTQAAKKLCLSQSALSHQLKEVESSCGGQVFNRVNKKMILTPLGKRIFQMATNVLQEMEDGAADIEKIVSGVNANIRISTQCYTFYHWLSDALLRYNAKYPEAEVQVVTEATYNVVKWLENGKLDLAIVNYKPDPNKFHLEKLFDDEIVVLASPAHPLAKKKFIRPLDLTQTHYLTYALPHGHYGKTYDQVFTAHGIAPQKITRIELTEAIIEMVKANLGVAILAKWAVEPYLINDRIKALPLTKNGTLRTWYAVTLPFRYPPKHLIAFINILKGLQLSRVVERSTNTSTDL